MSNLYGRPPGGGSKKVVISLVVVVAVLVGLVLFLWLKPASNDTTPGASPGPTAAPASNPAAPGATETGSTGSAQKSSGQWTIPVPGDGGPSTKSAEGVPRGYDDSDAGATKAALNAVVAARWMKFQVGDPANTLGVLAVPTAGDDRDAVLAQLTPKEVAGKQGTEQSPPGGKVLGAQLISRDAKTAVVLVLWEQFGKPSGGKVGVSIELMEVRLQWMQADWLISYLDRTVLNSAMPADLKGLGGQIGVIDESWPVPGEGWYW